MPRIWLCGGFGWLCPAFRDWMFDVRCSMFDVPDREPSRFAAGRNGLGCWTFWRLLALVAAANRDGSRSDPELDAALSQYILSTNTLGFSPSRHNLPLNRWRSNLNRSSTRKSSASRCGPWAASRRTTSNSSPFSKARAPAIRWTGHVQYCQPRNGMADRRMATEERVLCFERKLLEELGVFQGLSLEVEKYLAVVTSSSNLRYQNRSEAEQDKRFKQLIPYVLIICNGKILRYRRRGRGVGK